MFRRFKQEIASFFYSRIKAQLKRELMAVNWFDIINNSLLELRISIILSNLRLRSIEGID